MQSVFVLTSDQSLLATSCLLFLAQGLKIRLSCDCSDNSSFCEINDIVCLEGLESAQHGDPQDCCSMLQQHALSVILALVLALLQHHQHLTNSSKQQN